MVHWQFLLQKKGDRNWDILQTETLSLAPGEYRLAARGDAQVEIHCEICFPKGKDRSAQMSPPTRAYLRSCPCNTSVLESG